MADGTRISKLDDAVQKLRETSDRQQHLMTEIFQKIATMETKYEQIFQELRQKKERTIGIQSGNRQESGLGEGIQSHTLILEFPRFEGIDLAGWVYRVEQFFSYHQTPSNSYFHTIKLLRIRESTLLLST